MSYVPVFPFLGVSNWRELNDRGMNFIPTSGDAKLGGNELRHLAPRFWSGFARRDTVVPGGECVKKTAENCKFPAKLRGPFRCPRMLWPVRGQPGGLAPARAGAR